MTLQERFPTITFVQQPTTAPPSLASLLNEQLLAQPGLTTIDALGNRQSLFQIDIGADGFLVVTLPNTIAASVVTNAVQAAAAKSTQQQQQLDNQTTLIQRAQNALTANQTFLALLAPTNAQTLAQVQTLTRESSALIRLALGLFDSTAGT